jgi:hypothetical protein
MYLSVNNWKTCTLGTLYLYFGEFANCVLGHLADLKEATSITSSSEGSNGCDTRNGNWKL